MDTQFLRCFKCRQPIVISRNEHRHHSHGRMTGHCFTFTFLFCRQTEMMPASSSSSTSSPTIVLNVQTVQKESTTICMDPDDSFSDLKMAIASKFGLLSIGLKVVHGQKVLDVNDEEPVGTLGLGMFA